MDTYIGIDIGVTGAITVRHTHLKREDPGAWEIFDIGDYTLELTKKSGGIKTVYNCKALDALFKQFPGARATTEDLHAIGAPHGGPKQSRIGSPQSNYSLGLGTGIFEMACASNNIALYKVHTRSWKAHPMLKGVPAGDKEAIRLRCIQLYPELAQYLTRKMDHNRAESIFLEEIGRMTFFSSY